MPEFRPVPGVTYRVEVEDGPKKVYRSAIVFASAATGWDATERNFAIEGPFAPGQFGDLTGATLTWHLDALGNPLGKPVEAGNAKPETLAFASLFAFRFPVGAPLPACPGVGWTHVWKRPDGFFTNTVRFEVVAVGGASLRLSVDESSVSRINRWDSKGEWELARDDGLCGEMRTHVVGPGAPAVNVFDRVIRVRRAD